MIKMQCFPKYSSFELYKVTRVTKITSIPSMERLIKESFSFYCFVQSFVKDISHLEKYNSFCDKKIFRD